MATIDQLYALKAAAQRCIDATEAITLTNNSSATLASRLATAEADMTAALGVVGLTAGTSAIITSGVQYHQQVIRDGEPVVTATVTYTIANGVVTLVDSEIGG